MTIEWEESRWFLKNYMPYTPSSIARPGGGTQQLTPFLPSDVLHIGRVIAVGGFSKSPMVQLTLLMTLMAANTAPGR